MVYIVGETFTLKCDKDTYNDLKSTLSILQSGTRVDWIGYQIARIGFNKLAMRFKI